MSALVAAALTLAAVIAPAGPTSADPSPTCTLSANPPQWRDMQPPIGTIVGSGARAHGCVQSARLAVQLKKDISFWPDTTLATADWDGSDIHGHVAWTCVHRGNMKVYTEVRSSRGGKAQSVRASLFPCGN